MGKPSWPDAVRRNVCGCGTVVEFAGAGLHDAAPAHRPDVFAGLDSARGR